MTALWFAGKVTVEEVSGDYFTVVGKVTVE